MWCPLLDGPHPLPSRSAKAASSTIRSERRDLEVTMTALAVTANRSRPDRCQELPGRYKSPHSGGNVPRTPTPTKASVSPKDTTRYNLARSPAHVQDTPHHQPDERCERRPTAHAAGRPIQGWRGEQSRLVEHDEERDREGADASRQDRRHGGAVHISQRGGLRTYGSCHDDLQTH